MSLNKFPPTTMPASPNRIFPARLAGRIPVRASKPSDYGCCAEREFSTDLLARLLQRRVFGADVLDDLPGRGIGIMPPEFGTTCSPGAP
jgi:hypothetical protein